MSKTLLKTSVVIALISLTVIMLSTTAVISYAKPNTNGLGLPATLCDNSNLVGVGLQKMFRNQHMFPPGKQFGLGIRYGIFELSSEFKDKVLSILRSDRNVSRLLDEGYDISAIRPIIKIAVQGDGSAALKVAEVWVSLYKEGEGVVHVLINYGEGKVVKIWGCWLAK